MRSDQWRVSDFLLPNPLQWNETLIKEMFWAVDWNCILKIPLSHSAIYDKLVWHYDTKGAVSVKSGYKAIMNVKRSSSTSNGSNNKS